MKSFSGFGPVIANLTQDITYGQSRDGAQVANVNIAIPAGLRRIKDSYNYEPFSRYARLAVWDADVIAKLRESGIAKGDRVEFAVSDFYPGNIYTNKNGDETVGLEGKFEGFKLLAKSQKTQREPATAGAGGRGRSDFQDEGLDESIPF
jgi:hypothetical protein